jgi:transposase
VIDVRTEPRIDLLREAAVLLVAENERLRRQNVDLTRKLGQASGVDEGELEQQVLFLQEQLAAANRALFGAKSEKRPQAPSEADGQEPKEKTGHGPTEQPKLPIDEQVHLLDEPDQICPKCGGKLVPMSGLFEESDEITVVKVQFRVTRHKRQKYHCTACSHVDTALGPQKLIKGGRYSVDFATHVAIGKYADHLPLERQVEQMKRAGLTVMSQTLWDQIEAQAQLVEPTYQALGDYVRMAPVIGLDDTRWLVSQRKQERQIWTVWTITRPNAVFHYIDPSRSATSAGKVVKDFKGTVMADGYKAHETLQRLLTEQPGKPPFELAQCWAHVRRKFEAARKDYPAADEVLELIGDLYRVEREASATPLDSRLRVLADLRVTRSGPVAAKILDWLKTTPALPKSSLGKAIGYAQEHWPRLTKFLTNPLIPLDNNATERALRGPVVGRKNYYGSRSRRGTEVAAIFYSLIESAKLAGLEPAAYLNELTRRSLRNRGTVYLPVEMAAELASQAVEAEPAEPAADPERGFPQ